MNLFFPISSFPPFNNVIVMTIILISNLEILFLFNLNLTSNGIYLILDYISYSMLTMILRLYWSCSTLSVMT